MINLKSKIYLAGHKGLVGSSILRKLRSSGYKNIIFKSRKQLDLKNQKKVLQFLKKNTLLFLLKIEILSRINAHICKNWTYYLKRWARRSDFRLHTCISLSIFFTDKFKT